jgi:AraC-like DNA-binding protein/mannose-6-phosphate isomerase-like protein (cupin superfamily)
MKHPREHAILQETLWGADIGGALWPFQPLGWQYLRPLHLHDQYEVLFMRRGSLRLTLGRESVPLRPGQFAWIAPSVEHRVDQLSPDVDFWSLQLEPWLLTRALGGNERGVFSEPDLHTSLAAFSKELPDPPVILPASAYGDTFEQAAHTAWSTYLLQAARCPPNDERYSWIPRWDALSARAAQEGLVAVTRATLAATRSEAAAVPKKSIVRLAFDALLAEPSLSRSELCSALSVSEGYLSRHFPEVFGAGLANQRARLRLVRFLSLAKASRSQNLLRSSLQAGFGSYAQLHRVFAQHSTFAPSAYLQGQGLLAAGTVIRSG